MSELESCLYAIRAWIKAEDDAEHAASVMTTTDEPQQSTKAKANEARAEAVEALRAAIRAGAA